LVADIRVPALDELNREIVQLLEVVG
jgi:hypothetical protein